MTIKAKPKEVKKGQIPFWQLQEPVRRRVPPPKEEEYTGFFAPLFKLFEKTDLQKIRSGFKKKANKRDLPPCKMVLITGCCICCLLTMFASMFVFAMDIDVSYYLNPFNSP
jgi:hypothetical protein